MPKIDLRPTFEAGQWERLANVVQRLLLWVEPAGGQTVARRNAWVALVQDSRRRADRLEAERALPGGPALPREIAAV